MKACYLGVAYIYAKKIHLMNFSAVQNHSILKKLCLNYIKVKILPFSPSASHTVSSCISGDFCHSYKEHSLRSCPSFDSRCTRHIAFFSFSSVFHRCLWSFHLLLINQYLQKWSRNHFMCRGKCNKSRYPPSVFIWPGVIGLLNPAVLETAATWPLDSTLIAPSLSFELSRLEARIFRLSFFLPSTPRGGLSNPNLESMCWPWVIMGFWKFVWCNWVKFECSAARKR